MNKIFLVIQREYLIRVRKKSFLLATILTPILIGGIIGGLVYFAVNDAEKEVVRNVQVFNESSLVSLNNDSQFIFTEVAGNIEEVKISFQESDYYALIHIPSFTIDQNPNINLYTKNNIGIKEKYAIKNIINHSLREKKIEHYAVNKEAIEKLKTDININSYNIISDKKNSTEIAAAVAYLSGFFIYIFIFVYGAQVMHGVIEEKSGKITEVLLSNIRPFELMMGKVLGIASVGLTQFLIWVILSFAVSSAVFSLTDLGLEATNPALNITNEPVPSGDMDLVLSTLNDIPFFSMISLFIFYFIGGYLIYGALFAAIGSAVDSQGEAQQFMLPITLPLIASIISLSFIVQKPDSTLAMIFSLLPFTSPVSMMARIGFGWPPWYELASSIGLLCLGFIFTIWVASRIYRIGILIHGSKVNYRILLKWIFMKG